MMVHSSGLNTILFQFEKVLPISLMILLEFGNLWYGFSKHSLIGIVEVYLNLHIIYLYE